MFTDYQDIKKEETLEEKEYKIEPEGTPLDMDLLSHFTFGDMPVNKILRHFEYRKKALEAQSGTELPVDEPNFFDACKYLLKAIQDGFVEDNVVLDYFQKVTQFLRIFSYDKKSSDSDQRERLHIDDKLVIYNDVYDLIFNSKPKFWETLTFFALRQVMVFLYKLRLDIVKVDKKEGKISVTGNSIYEELERRISKYHNESIDGWDYEDKQDKQELPFPFWVYLVVNSKKEEEVFRPEHIPSGDKGFEIWRAELLLIQTLYKNLLYQEGNCFQKDISFLSRELGMIGKNYNNAPENEDWSRYQEVLEETLKHMNNGTNSDRALEDSNRGRLLVYCLNAAEKIYNVKGLTPKKDDKRSEKALDSALHTYWGIFNALGEFLKDISRDSKRTKEHDSAIKHTYWNIVTKLFQGYGHKIQFKKKIYGSVPNEKYREYRDKLKGLIMRNEISGLPMAFSDEECRWYRIKEIARVMVNLKWAGTKNTGSDNTESFTTDAYKEEITIYNSVKANLPKKINGEFERALKSCTDIFNGEKDNVNDSVKDILTILREIGKVDEGWELTEHTDSWVNQLTKRDNSDGSNLRIQESFIGILANNVFPKDKSTVSIDILNGLKLKRFPELVKVLCKWIKTSQNKWDISNGSTIGLIGSSVNISKNGLAHLCYFFARLVTGLGNQLEMMDMIGNIFPKERAEGVTSAEAMHKWSLPEAKTANEKAAYSEWTRYHDELQRSYDYLYNYKGDPTKTLEAVRKLHYPKATARVFDLFKLEDGLKYMVHNYPDLNLTATELFEKWKFKWKEIKEYLRNNGTPAPGHLEALIDAYLLGSDKWIGINEKMEAEQFSDNLSSPSWTEHYKENIWSYPYDCRKIEPFNGVPAAFQRSIKLEEGLYGVVKNIVDQYKSDYPQFQTQDPYWIKAVAERKRSYLGKHPIYTLNRIIGSAVKNFISQSIEKRESIESVPKLKFNYFKRVRDGYYEISLWMINTSSQAGNPYKTLEDVRGCLKGNTGDTISQLCGLADYTVLHKTSDESNDVVANNYLSAQDLDITESISEEKFAEWVHSRFLPNDEEEAKRDSIPWMDISKEGQRQRYEGYTEILTFYDTIIKQ